MARKKSGIFNRALNFIGLVDDGDPRDNYEDNYNNADNYGQQQAYAPQRNQRAQASRTRPDAGARRSYEPGRSYESSRAPQMNRNSRFDQPQRGNSQSNRSADRPRTESRSSGYDYSPRTSRFGEVPGDNNSRFDDSHNQRSASRQRTIMFSLRNMEDCCDVIDQLIANTTVVLTLDELDPKLSQRAVDTLSGAVFALRATIRKASENTYLLAPNGVEVDNTYDADYRF